MLSSWRLLLGVLFLACSTNLPPSDAASSPPTVKKIIVFRTEGLVSFLCFSPDSSTIAYGLAPIGLEPSCIPATVLLSSASGKEITRFPDTLGGYPGLGIFSPKGELLAVGTTTAGIFLWDVRKRKCLGPLDEGKWVGDPLAFSPDGTKLAKLSVKLTHRPGDRFDDIVLWDVATRRKVLSFGAKEHGVIRAFAFAGDGKTLLADHHLFQNRDRRDDRIEKWEMTVHLWDTVTGKEMGGIGGKRDWMGSRYERLPPGQQLTELGIRPVPVTQPFNYAAEVVVGPPPGGHRIVRAASGRCYVLPSWQRLPLNASASRDGTIRLIDAGSDRVLAQLNELLGKDIRTFAISPDGTKLVAAADSTRSPVSTIFLWDLTTLVNRTDVPKKSLSPQALDQIWRDLASDHAAGKAHPAMRTLVHAPPEQVLTFLRKRLDRILNPSCSASLFRQLGADNFNRRTQASLEVESVGWPMVPLIEASLAEKPNIDFQRRLETSRSEILRTAPEWEAAGFRLIDVLLQIDSPDSLDLLTAISQAKTATPWRQVAREATLSRARQR